MSDRKRISNRRKLVIGVLIVAIGGAAVVIYNAHQEHLETVQRTRAVAADTLQGTEQALEAVTPLSAADRSALRTFRNEEHVAIAKQLGIAEVGSRAVVADLVQSQKLVRIENNRFYRIQELDYSIPYVTPDAANLLEKIGRRFQSRLAERGLPPYQFVVTSVTRSEEDQDALRQVNINAAVESSHEFGTTFDIHYGKFGYEAQPAVPEDAEIYRAEFRDFISEGYSELAAEHTEALKTVLGEVLLELQQREDAMVIYERRQPVYHVTVSQPIPEPPPRIRPDTSFQSSLVNLSKK